MGHYLEVIGADVQYKGQTAFLATAHVTKSNTNLSAWSLHVFPVPAWVYSGYTGFFSHSKDTLVV